MLLIVGFEPNVAQSRQMVLATKSRLPKRKVWDTGFIV